VSAEFSPVPVENAIIGDFLRFDLGPTRMRELVRQYQLKSEHFTDPTLRSVFDLLMADESADLPKLQLKAIACASQKTIEYAIEHSDVTSTDAELNIKTLSNRGYQTRFRQIVNEMIGLYGENSSPNFVADSISDAMHRELSDRTISAASSKLADLANPIPEDEDPDCLFRGRFLNKGGVMFLISIAGSGKSVITMQLAYAWAMGRPTFGITPVRKLKIGIFQTEDDDHDLAEFRASMREGYERFHGWTKADWQEAEQSIFFHPTGGKTGKEFIALMREVQSVEHHDIIIINPLQGVTGFDIAQNVNLSEFLRHDVDSVIKQNPDTKCGLIIVHHTNKPPSPRDRSGFGRDQYAEYVGAGGAEIPNTTRAVLTIMPGPEPGQYYLTAAKRGERLDWPAIPKVNTSKPTRIIRHSTKEEGLMFWHDVQGGETRSEPGENRRPSVTRDAAQLASHLQQEARTLTEARKFAKELFTCSRGSAAYEEILANLSNYNVVIKPTGISNRSLIGSPESINALSAKLDMIEKEKLQAKLDRKRAAAK